MIIGISGKIGSGKDTIAKIIQCLDAGYNLDETIHTIKGGFRDSGLLPFSDETKWEVKKFADKLKEICAIMLGVDRSKLEDQVFKDSLLPDDWQEYHVNGTGYLAKNIRFSTREEAEVFIKNIQSSYVKTAHYIKSTRTVRWLMQYIGTDLFRERLHHNIHINMLFNTYIAESLKDNPQLNVADYSNSDFPNWIITDVRFHNEAKAIIDRGGIVIRVERCWTCKRSIREQMKGCNELTCPKGQKQHESETALDNFVGFHYTIDNNGDINNLIEKVKEILEAEKILITNGR